MAANSSEEIKVKLEETIAGYQKRALAYYLHFESSERKMSQDVKNELKEKYGKETFMPVLNWTESFGENLSDSDELDTAILKHFDSINYDKEKFVRPKDRLKNMIWNACREEGKAILEKL